MNKLNIFLTGFLLIGQTLAHPETLPSSLQPVESNIKILSDEIECDQSQKKCIAKGNAIAEKLHDPKVKILKADQIIAHFANEGENGPLKVTQLEAEGHVIFIIDDTIIQGLKGNYIVETETAEVFDQVKITNGTNQLDGGYAKVNMKTGHYSIKHDGEQVSALIFSKDKKDES